MMCLNCNLCWIRKNSYPKEDGKFWSFWFISPYYLISAQLGLMFLPAKFLSPVQFILYEIFNILDYDLNPDTKSYLALESGILIITEKPISCSGEVPSR